MTSLEFINTEIAITRSKYKEHINFNHTSFAIKDEKKLKTLQQIKTELEAWEVVKHRLRKGTSIIIMDSIPITHPGYRTIKKVLEVK